MISKPAPRSIKDFKLIGILGKAGSGKDTTAAYLCNNFDAYRSAYWCKKVALADKVKDVVAAVFNLNAVVYAARQLKEQPIPELDNYSYRTLTQLVGTECFRTVFGEWVWVSALHAKLTDMYWVGEAVVVSDIRFDNEVQWILEQDGIIVYLNRPDAQPVAAHSSEQIPTLQYCQDAVSAYGGAVVYVENNGSLQDLYAAIEKQVVPLLKPV